MVHTKGVAHPAAFRPFEAVRPQLLDTMRTTTVGELTEEASGFMPSGWCDLGATVTYQNRLDVMRAVHKITDEVFGTVSHVPNMTWIFSFEPLPTKLTQLSFERGDMTGLNRTRDNLILMMLAPRWADAVYDDQMYDAAKTWVRRVNEATSAAGAHDHFLYLKYAGAFQDPLSGYGDANVRFLRQVSQKYDPSGVFQTLMPGGFKIMQSS